MTGVMEEGRGEEDFMTKLRSTKYSIPFPMPKSVKLVVNEVFPDGDSKASLWGFQ